MKKILALLIGILIYSANIAYAQKNVIKARFFAWPGGASLRSIGLGYERILDNNSAIQLLYNNYKINISRLDGGNIVTNSLVPEYRVYLGEDFKRTFFLGIFSEFNRTVNTSGVYEGRKLLIERVDDIIAPGILVGGNFIKVYKFYVESYVGLRYRFIFRKDNYIENREIIFENSQLGNLRLRGGVNIGFRF